MKKLIIVFIALNVGLISYIVYKQFNNSKVAYVNIQQLFNGFELKKDYEKKLTATTTSRKKIIDSLETELKVLGRKIENENQKNKDDLNIFSVKRENYFQKKKLFEEDNVKQTKQYDSEIISQLNQYVKDYGKENGYLCIYGSDGNGSLMYMEEKHDATAAVIEYINMRYRGIK